MSEEKAELVLAFHAAYNARDLDAAVELCAVDVEVFPDQSVFPEAAALVGREQFKAFLEDTWAAWTSGSVTPQEVLQLDGGGVLVRANWEATGSASGAEIATNLSAIYTVQDGRISQARYFFDHDQARKAAGLAE